MHGHGQGAPRSGEWEVSRSRLVDLMPSSLLSEAAQTFLRSKSSAKACTTKPELLSAETSSSLQQQHNRAQNTRSALLSQPNGKHILSSPPHPTWWNRNTAIKLESLISSENWNRICKHVSLNSQQKSQSFFASAFCSSAQDWLKIDTKFDAPLNAPLTCALCNIFVHDAVPLTRRTASSLVSSARIEMSTEETSLQKVCAIFSLHSLHQPSPIFWWTIERLYTLEITDQALRSGADIKWLFLSLLHTSQPFHKLFFWTSLTMLIDRYTPQSSTTPPSSCDEAALGSDYKPNEQDMPTLWQA